MKLLFPSVFFNVKMTFISLFSFLVVAFLACAGINGCIDLIGIPNDIAMVLKVICTVYFVFAIFIAVLNLIGIIKVKES